jgi:hypothetical protein
MAGEPDSRDPLSRPPDPAGTRPKVDPASLLPARREPPGDDEVVDAQVVDEQEADGSLLPERRAAAGAPAIATPESAPYAPRFHFLTGALIAFGAAAIAALVLFVVQPGKNDRVVRDWSTWRPSDGGKTGAAEIAQHVGTQYRFGNGQQMVSVEASTLSIEGVPLSVAVREAPDQGGEIRVFDDNGLIYRLCGLGPYCSINKGKPSRERHLLLRREALELALYSFRYLDNVKQIVVFMPPPPGQRPSQAVFFRRGDVEPELDRPLERSLADRAPTVRNVTLSPDATLVDQLTSAKLFNYSLTPANTENRGFLVLDPLTDAQRTPQQKKSPGKSGSSTTTTSSKSSSSQR